MTRRPQPTSPSSLNAAQRAASLQRLAHERYDVIVVGGGVTGAGVALDAAARGLRTALVERVDLAAGTSRWSSKLIHGGLRYLASGDLGIAYESARERHHLMTHIAPHLTRPLHNVVPDAGVGASVLSNAGIFLADGLRRAARTPSDTLAPPRRVNAEQVHDLTPAARHGMRGIRYTDGQLEDDARLVVTLARTAAAYGADIVTRCAATPLDDDRVELRDELTGETCVARGHVVLATGVWIGETDERITVTPSRGSHLVVPADLLGNPRAQLSAPVPGHFGRFVFAIPIDDHLALIGLTDEAAPGVDGIAPPVPQDDENFLLATMNAVLARPIAAAEVVGRFAGLRPLVSLAPSGDDVAVEGNSPASTADASRRHLLLDEPGRPVTITGGKLTTYRQMAQDAVDAVTKRVDADVPACCTTRLPLLGAAPRATLATAAAPPRLVRRYGTMAPDVVDLTTQDTSLSSSVAQGCPTIRAEFTYAVQHEGALTVEDLVERRTRVSFVAAQVDEARRTAQEILDAESVTPQ